MDLIETGRHPVNIGHLVMGIAFLGLVGVWALIQSDAVGGSEIRWLMPVPWVFAGVAGILATILTARRHSTTQTGQAGQAAGVEPDGDETGDQLR